MSLQAVPSSERIHIGFFGLRNAGKSSLVNAVTGQELSLVSAVKGTTTDPVKKAMELLPLGPVVIIDTPGMDDEGELGGQRVRRARQILAQTDIAVLVTDAAAGLRPMERELIALFEERRLPYIVAYNKTDLGKNAKTGEKSLPPAAPREAAAGTAEASQRAISQEIYVSALTGEGIRELKERLGDFARAFEGQRRCLVSDLLSPGDIAVLVMPIDESAPKGRLILPQQQVMRDILDAHGRFIACQPEELRETLAALAAKPKLVITDSQVFGRAARDVPEDIWLTSFSILFARRKGDLETLVRGAALLSRLTEGDRVLISEGCTHHRQCGDIGTVKLPRWIADFCGADIRFDFTSGGEFPEDISPYRLVVHCGGCMLNDKEMQRRLRAAAACGVPVVNYGVAIAQIHGILRRSLEPFPRAAALLPQ